MLPISPAQDTTPLALPALPLAAVRGIVETLQAAYPDEQARIARGVAVLLTSAIVPTAELGRYRVQSCQDGRVYYAATSWSCDCPDRQRHDARCKHSWALEILHCATAIACREQAERRYWLTAEAERALAAM
jgi:hypothetical protein